VPSPPRLVSCWNHWDVWRAPAADHAFTDAVSGPAVPNLGRPRLAWHSGRDGNSRIPDLEIREGPAPLRALFLLGTNYPFQLLAIGGGLELRAPSWLHVGLTYTIGFAVAEQDTTLFGQYAEAAIGLRLHHALTQRDVDIFPKKRPSPVNGVTAVSPRPELKVSLPSSQSLFIEGGAFTGLIQFANCAGDCSENSESDWTRRPRQLFYPFGGLRYLYFVDVSSRSKPQLTRRQEIEVRAHLIGKPANQLASATHWGNDEELERASLGAHVGLRFPTCRDGRCAKRVLAGGYLPLPAGPYFEVGVGN
jgi:hypothetical protein